VVADAAQNIFRRKFSWRQAGIQAQGRTRILRTNYRNTREILQFAFDYLVDGGVVQGEAPDPEDEHTVIPPEAACRSGPEPLLIERATDNERVETAAERAAVWARRPNAAPRSIGVLYPSSQTTGMALARRLQALGVRHFWLADPANKKNRDMLAMAREPVVLTTIHSAKGLEFDQVVVCGLDHPQFEAGECRKLAYVAMTRAREELVVVR